MQRQPNFRRLFAAFFAAAVFLSAHSVSAFTFEPISADFSPSGRNSVRTFRLENNTETTVAVQVTVFSRRADEDGGDILEEAGDLFLVYPSQVVLRPGAFQAVRVQWRGTAKPVRELPFRIIAEQLPVSFDSRRSTGSSINIMFRYVGSLYVAPEGASPDIQVESAGVSKKDGERILELVLSNVGGAHAILGDPSLEVYSRTDNSPSDRLVLTGTALKGLTGENILAGHRRRFFLPCPADIPEGPLGASLQYDTIR